MSTQSSASRRLALAAIGALLLLSLTLYLLLSGPSRASAPPDAVKAAEEIAQRQGGGEQPRTPEGTPRDAVVPPNAPPGRITISPKN